MTRHVVQMSGGLGSFWTAVRVAERYGTADLTLLFADTTSEDPDLYRFMDDACAYLGVNPVLVADGRDPWQVFDDAHFLGNSRVAPCSKLLKQKPCRDWMTANTNPADTVVYVGIDPGAKDLRRIPGIRRRWNPWHVEFPMAEPPLWTKQQMQDECASLGIAVPYLYTLGFEHNNCGGLCVRAGQGHWRHLLDVLPDRFAEAELNEQEFRTTRKRDVAILAEIVDGVKRPLPLSELRLRVEAGASR